MPRAFPMGKSRRGEEMAATAAALARDFPSPVPTPMRAVPAFDMIDLTSAKSTLIIPGLMIISEIPTTPCLKISSATKNASVTGVSSGTIFNNRSLLTTIRVSTTSLNSSIARSACLILFLPSNPNGFVTTPTVRHPHSSLAIFATIGAAPLPVPPPMPAVTNTRSAPAQIFSISSRLSSAAAHPTSGTPPAPSPRVTAAPMLRRLRDIDRSRA
mmetsp:Transcript_18546/g.42408  ORF Transcript_18546/g.42408 Transcript_18546/m.42408 type:complete len:214 (+) Transcript_18546:611-1252(+)